MLRYYVSTTLAIGLIFAGIIVIYVEMGRDVPRKLWIMGPFLLIVWIVWLIDDLRR